MSFSSTPLGQGRRLDHRTFLNKANAKRAPNSPTRRAITTSYSYGAPTVATRSPPKATSANISRTTASADPTDDVDETALVRFARLKQREQAKTREVTSVAPDKWSFKDTSVNIASAFNQAVEVGIGSSTNTATMPPSNNPNMDAWASSARKQPLPRSTSVEYEAQKQSTLNRRLAPPPNRTGAPRAPRPISQTSSYTNIPDSEDEFLDVSSRRARGKTPLEQVMEMTQRLPPVAFFMRQRSQEPEGNTSNSMNGNGNVSAQDQSSYSYSAEERDYQANAQKPLSRRGNPMHRRNRMSTDNKAYHPSMSDLEESDEDYVDDNGKRSRRKKRKSSGALGGPPLTSLPVAGYDKRRRKRKGGKANGTPGEGEEESSDEQSQSQSFDQSYEQPSMLPPRPPSALAQYSIPPLTSMQASMRRASPLPDYSARIDGSTFDVERALATATEDELGPEEDASFSQSTFSIGAALGRAVHILYQLTWGLARFLLSIFAHILEITVHKPVQLVSSLNHAPLTQFVKYAVVGLTLYAAWYGLNEGYLSGIPLPRFSSNKEHFHAPEIPASNLGELSDRLLRLEHALETLSQDAQRSRDIMIGDGRAQTELASRLGSLESRLQRDTIRLTEAEAKSRQATTDNFRLVRQELEALQAQLQAQREAEARVPQDPTSDEEARAQLRALEERVGSVENGVKEAIDLGKNAVKVDSGSGAAWWQKLAAGSSAGSSLTIKSSDGQDVTALLGHLVDNAVSHWSKDVLARPDYALFSSGALIIPSLTSDTMEVKPSGLLSQAVGYITGGNGHPIGRPPVTALHHEIHTGHCWPFAGSQGQLGVALSSPIRVTDFTIDHVAKEVAADMRSAPRQMEVWGLVEGKDNVAKLQAYKDERSATTELAGQLSPENEYPATLPKRPEYMRIANFTYNIYDSRHIQTFTVPEEIQELGIDFGVVVLLVKNNWGRDDYTCLYRFRVHGEVAKPIPAPLPEDVL